MNKQRKVVITTTYNEMGIIIDTKAEEVAQSNLQPTCNQLATDCISRRAAIDALEESKKTYFDRRVIIGKMQDILVNLPSAQPEIIRCEKCEHYTAVTGICEVRGKGLILIRRPDEFCSRGERREECPRNVSLIF